ncbi:MAG: AhpC/TSA family protein [Alistipes sp.]|nr:AhpC/TSA family protein [Alistipes sp.]
MKKFVIYILTIVSFVACKDNSSSRFVLDCTITNAAQGEMVCLIYPVKHEGIWYKQCDTAYINNGKCCFKGKVDDVVPASLVFANMDELNTYIAPSNTKLCAERSTIYDYSISGLKIGDEIKEYNKFFAAINKKIYQKQHLIHRKSEEYATAYTSNADSAQTLALEFYNLIEEYKAIFPEWSAMAVKFTNSHPDYAIIPNIIDKLAHSGYDASAIELLCKNLSDEQRQSALGELMSIRCEIAKSNCGIVGSKALDFTLTSVDDKAITLSECYAKSFVLLDFWASWCGPCIREIPKLQKLHSQHKDRLQIISISVDESKAQWQDAIAKHELSQWSQLIANNNEECYFVEQANTALAYGVEQIPCFILIDSNGTIIGRWSHLTADATKEIEQLIN